MTVLSLESPKSWTVCLAVVGTDQEETVKTSAKLLQSQKPQVCFCGSSSDVLRCTLSRKGTTETFDASLGMLPFGCDVQTKKRLREVEVVLEMCAFDFGVQQAEREGDGGPATVKEKSAMLVSLVLDATLYELRDVRGAKSGSVEVALQHASASVFRTSGDYAVRPGVPVVMEGEDCSFFADLLDRTLSIAVHDKKGDAVMGASVVLSEARFMVKKPRAFWIELRGREAGVGAWARMRLQMTEEGSQESFLARYGDPLHSLPFRVTYGDVILFDDPGLGAGLVSLSTGSRYDHIGIVVPAPPHDKRNLLEASRKGCFGVPLDERIKSALSAGVRVAVRRLVGVERNEWCKDVLRAFLERHEGKGYEKVMTIVRSRFRANSHEELTELFCSELVARALMDLNALDSDSRLANNFLPSDFAQDRVPGQALPHMFETLKLHSNSGRRRARSRAASMEVSGDAQTPPPQRPSNSSPRNLLSPRTSARSSVRALLSPLSPRREATKAHKRGKSLGVPKSPAPDNDELQ